MAFADLVAADGSGRVWLVEVSFDDFSTVSHRWSDRSTRIGTDEYQARICEGGMKPLQRGIGVEHLVQAGTVDLLLDNTDAGLDWLVDRATVASQVMRARFRLSLAMWDPTVSYTLSPLAADQVKVMGTFKALDFPSRDNANVRLQLADDMMGAFNDPLAAPTIRDWKDDAGSTFANCPLHDDYQVTPYTDWDVPVQLAFGLDHINCFMAAAAQAVDYQDASGPVAVNAKRAIIVCATRDLSDVDPRNDIFDLRGTYGSDVKLGQEPWDGAGTTIGIPETFTYSTDGGRTFRTARIWEAKKTQIITKAGVQWRILYVEFDPPAYTVWWQATNNSTIQGGTNTSGGTNPSASGFPVAPTGRWQYPKFSEAMLAFTHFKVLGRRLSHVTFSPAPAQAGVNVLRDLLKYYSKAGSAVDDTSFDSVLSGNSTVVAGVVLPTRVLPLNQGRFSFRADIAVPAVLRPGTLLQAVTEICASIEVDIVMGWSGTVRCLGSWLTFTNLTAARTTLDELRDTDVVERIPSKGERWAPYNRLWVLAPNGSTHGPYVNQDAVDEWGTVIDRTVEGKWLSSGNIITGEAESTAWNVMARLESVVRPVIHFKTDRAALLLEIGDLFEFTWTRGGSAGPYNSATVFRIEAMAVDPENLDVTIEAVWVDDIRTIFPYLLDNEDLVVRLNPVTAGAGTLTVQDSSTAMILSVGGLVAAGVAVHDIVVLKDSTQAANVFTRYRKLRIVGITADNEFEVHPLSDLDFDAAGPTAIAQANWRIERGARTYPNSSSDPTNYPSDGAMYGKACDDADEYSNTTDANKLL